MELYFKTCKYDTCGISITGLEKENQQYSVDSTKDTYSYEDSVSLNVLVPVNKEGEDELPYDQYQIVEHTGEDKSIFTFPKDGLFKIVHAIIPTKAWYNEFGGTVSHNMYYYYRNPDQKEGKFYKQVNGKIEEVTIQEVISVDWNSGSDSTKCTIYKGVQYTFNICNTEQCLYSFSQDFLNKMCSSNCDSNVDVRNRDLVFMAVHILKYLIDLGRYFEAQELVEKLHSCTGVCKQINNKISNSGGCGCAS